MSPPEHHFQYDGFGNAVGPTSPAAADFLFGFTGRPFDADTSLQWNLNRWYDPAVGRWLSEDPIGFSAGDENLYRYVGNQATGAIDPYGFAEVTEAYDPVTEERYVPSYHVDFSRVLPNGNQLPYMVINGRYYTSSTRKTLRVYVDDPGQIDPTMPLQRLEASVQRDFQELAGVKGPTWYEINPIVFRPDTMRELTPTEIWALRGGPLTTGSEWANEGISDVLRFFALTDVRAMQDNILMGVPQQVALKQAGVEAGKNIAIELATLGAGKLVAGLRRLKNLKGAGLADDIVREGAEAVDDLSTCVRRGKVADDLAAPASNAGRAGKQARLRELGADPNVSSADRGWIQQEINSIERGQRTNIRVPPGKNMAHRRGFEAKKGYSYEHSDLQDIDLHRLQHRHEGY